MDVLEIARWQFGIITVYHFLFVPITIGLSAIVAAFETIWVRTHNDADDLAAKTKAFQEKRAELNITLGGNVAKMEIREVESA